jgi:secondary thiamine-phosphate synthase enzyme
MLFLPLQTVEMANVMVNSAALSDIWQTQCSLQQKPRGFHLITEEIKTAMQDMPLFEIGLMHLFLQHTSASLAISENACKDVAVDLEHYFNRAIPDDNSLYRHTLEGEDDMPAHIKNVMLGANLTIPVQNNIIMLGQWQGIFLCEHRNHAGQRNMVITVQGKVLR